MRMRCVCWDEKYSTVHKVETHFKCWVQKTCSSINIIYFYFIFIHPYFYFSKLYSRYIFFVCVILGFLKIESPWKEDYSGGRLSTRVIRCFGIISWKKSWKPWKTIRISYYNKISNCLWHNVIVKCFEVFYLNCFFFFFRFYEI